MDKPFFKNNRILVVDDNPDIHRDFKKILTSRIDHMEMAELEVALFDVSDLPQNAEAYDLSFAFSGEEAIEFLKEVKEQDLPFAVAFVDMRMPPGWDGLETVKQIWKVDPDIQVVICTAYSDYSRDAIVDKLGICDRLLVIKKPFDVIEITQMACALTRKWCLAKEAALSIDKLTSLVDEKTEELKIANQHMETLARKATLASAMKSEFLANMSHEIRTPLNGIIGMSELLHRTALTLEQVEYVDIIQSSGSALLAVVNDILDFSKIEAGKLSIESITFDLRSIMDSVVDVVGYKAAEKNLEFSCIVHPNVPHLVVGDPDRLRQILINLAGNAVKFTNDGSVSIQVSINNETDDAHELYFEVIDTGSGIPKDRQNTIFDAFSQGDTSTTRIHGGTGLGLAISNRLSKLMGGGIGLVSEPGRGAKFWFTITFKKADADPIEDSNRETNLKDRRLLIVDSSSTSRQILNAQVSSLGGICQEAATAAEGISLLEDAVDNKEPFEVAMIFVNLPDMDGVEMGRQVKNSPTLQETKLVLTKIIKDEGACEKARKAGFSACISKPFKHAHLRNCLEDLFPNVQQAQNSVVEDAANSHSKSDSRILLAEDNPVNKKVALFILQKLGYRVECVSNGKEAIDMLKKAHFNLVLMDLHMPVLDGFEATKAIRRYEVSTNRDQGCDPSRVPIVAMTADAWVNVEEKCRAVGMDDFLSKPVQLIELEHTLKKWLSII